MRYPLIFMGMLFGGTSLSVSAQPAPAIARPVPRTYNIPPQDLGGALNAFAEQSDVQILFSPETVRGKRSGGLSGRFAPDEALRLLLRGSGLTSSPGAGATIVVRPAGQVSDASVLDTVPVASAAAPAASEPEIVVTGSNIRGGRSASPTTIITRKDIERSGLATTQQLLSRLPQQFGGSASESTLGGITGPSQSAFNVSGGSGLDLRGLGSDSTLVLIDGHRVASTGIGNYVDVSLIPLSALERVEVVADGASAVYGSDAVGGVANFILRKDFNGLETRARIGSVTEGNSTEYEFGQLAGKSWSTGNLLASYEYYERGNLKAHDRDFASGTEEPFDVLPSQQRHSLLLTGEQKIGDSFEIFGDALYAHRKSRADFHFPGFPPDLAGAVTKQIGGSFGARAHLPHGWAVEARGSYDHNRTNQLEQFASDFSGSSYSADVKADGPVLPLPGGDLKLAVGGQYRHENLHRARVDPSQDLDFRSSGQRHVWAAFGEAFAPLVGPQNARPGLERLEITLAGRYDRYSDFGDTFNPKVGLVYSPLPGLRLRGTYGTAFRAPLLFELDESDGQYIPFPAADPLSPSGVTYTLVLLGRKADLKPEKARTFSAGLNYAPPKLSGLNVSATYFDVDFKNRIGEPPLDAFLLSGLGAGPSLDPFITRNVPQSLIEAYAARPQFQNILDIPLDQVTAIADLRTTNLARTRVRGIDADLRYGWELGLGRLDAEVAATYLIDHKTQFGPGEPLLELVSTRFNPVDLVATGSLTWSWRGWSANAFLHYTDSYKDPTSVPGEVFPIHSWTTLDLALQYDTGSTPRAKALRNLKLGLTVLNLFDADPPFVRNTDGVNFDGANANPLGRFVSFQLTKSF
jgi:outer membrane receptor protein involved in Fe transport